MSQTQRVVGQVLRNITVQIREHVSREIRGTGVLVSPSGLVVTCAHVVRDCGVDPHGLSEAKVSVHIPATPEHEAEDRDAYVSWYPPASDDDLVLLTITGDPIPPERIGTFGPAADQSDQHVFRSFGFRQRQEYLGLLAKGSIEGHVPSSRSFLIEPVQLESRDLDSGMSGAAVFDVERNLIVGFVFQVWDSGESQKDRDLAFAVDAAVLSHSPAGELLVHTALLHEPLPAPEVDRSIVPSVAALDERTGPDHWAIETAPDILSVFVGRRDELHLMDNTWRDGHVKILGLSGLNGQGKTSLVRRFLDDLRESENRPQSVFWWTFDPSINEVDDFLAALIKHASAGAVDPTILPLGTAKANLAALLLQSEQRHMVILDGLDRLQADTGELAGSFTSQALRDFLSYVAAGNHRSLCILTGPRYYSDLEPVATFLGVPVGPLSRDEGRLLLSSNGVIGDDQVLGEIVDDWEGHPLALTAVAAYLRSRWAGNARRLAELPDVGTDMPFAVRLQAVGAAIEQRRSEQEQGALAILALARLPIPISILMGIVNEDVPTTDTVELQLQITDLARSGVVRMTSAGDLLLHPVLRGLYRAWLNQENPDSLSSRHRSLAEYYYCAALTPPTKEARVT